MSEDIEAIYSRMQERLQRFNIALRRGQGGRVFYATSPQAAAYSENYTIRWSESAQNWICAPIAGSQEEARRILRIALGEAS